VTTNDNGEVGYGKPPTRSQFKKGQSGNPKGRPKGSRNIGTVLEKTLRESVVINENGQRRTISKLEAAVKQLVNGAASGDLAAFRILASLASVGEGVVCGDSERPVMSEEDQKVLARMMERFGQSAKGPTP
jgi:hypothetical protein